MPSQRFSHPGCLAVAGIVLAAVLAYAGSLTGAFVFDDAPAILENPTLRHLGRLGGVLAPPGDEAGTVGGRPLLNLSLAVNYALGGERVWGYHALNLAIHILAGLTLFGLTRRTLQSAARARRHPLGVEGGPASAGRTAPSPTLLAFIIALLWAVHPLQTEAVTYVVQRAESLMGLFYLLTLYCFIRHAEAAGSAKAWRLPLQASSGTRQRFVAGWAVLSTLACLLGMATKEVMVSAPIIVFLYDRTFSAGSFREAWRRRRGYYLGLGATWLFLAPLVAGTHGRGGSAGFAAPGGIWPYALTQCRAIATYLRLAIWPRPLVFDYGIELVHHLGAVFPAALLVALLLGATLWGLLRRPMAGFLGAWFFGILAPSSSLVPIATEPMAEHRMYLPLAAVIALAVLAVHAVLLRVLRRRAAPALLVLSMAAAGALAAATVVRNRAYQSEVALWRDTVAKVPGNARAHNDLGTALRAQGEGAGAAAEFAAAVRAQPDYAPAQYNLGVTLLDSGRPAEALPHLERALSAPRHQGELQLYLGEALAQLGRFAESAEHAREALRLAPDNAEAAFAWGNALAAQGRYRAAAEAFRRAVNSAPDRVQLRNNLANALLLSGQVDAAVVQYREALRRRPDDGTIRQNLEQALLLLDSGRPPR